MRIRRGLVIAVLTCTVLLTGYKVDPTSALAVPGRLPDDVSDGTPGAKRGSVAPALAPGEFRFTTGLDKVPQHIHGPVVCDTRDGIHRIVIGDPDAGGVEVGLSADESTLKYADLGYRNGVYLMLVNDGDSGRAAGKTAPAVRKAGMTYVASGYATGMTATQQNIDRYFEIAVTCP